ncbi:phosphoglycerate dehydrogenase [Halorubrum californiense DSM 19288]|uniref:Phosphoglycerate dehydrogenase n=1 Tax=Halorubrum californiense DSM 19288 TaxID=1227465 RepID=M0E3E9_9EURY|nr:MULTISPECIES: D-2-hydroxyacid dehydrogenase [Halorubrum]ELZ41538.1 phosphoglycerate dehydrogenase [Halorubrum californiense DSM 19288]TKX70327.1 D-2-hydroxyacid dehydrogenase [Halorubrum sp. GN11GM_10-3_MGM]
MNERIDAATDSGETNVLLHHSVSAVFGDDFVERLRSRVDGALPSGDRVETATTAEESHAAVGDVDIVLTIRSVSEELPDGTAPNWIQTLNSGVDSYDLETLAEREVAVTNAAGVAAEPIAEQVLGYLLVFERRIHKGIRRQERDGVWRRYSAGELSGKTLGIVGVGAIGTRVAELASAFDMEVIGTKRTPETAPDVVDEAYPPDRLTELLARSDYLVLACPLVEATRGLIGAEEFMSMRSDAVLANVARGEVVEEAALETALQQNRIRGAALDVFEEEPLPPESPLWDLPNAVITPHMAGSTPKYADRVGSLFEENYRRYAAGDLEALRNRIV